MICIELRTELSYQVRAWNGADFIFNVHAARTAHQRVTRESLVISQDVDAETTTDDATGNVMTRLHAAQGALQVSYSATIELRHHLTAPEVLYEVPIRSIPLEVMPYVFPSRYCQSDRLLNFAFREFGQIPGGYYRVLAIQQWVQRHVAFTSNTTNSNTSAIDTLVERVGVCRDFAHLMIALCRALSIPARMATGTDYGADPSLGAPDFHAYVEVFLGDRWYIFDASGTGIPMGFVRLGTGRDAADVAFATIFGGVISYAPAVSTHAVESAQTETPRHCREALSTTDACHAPAGHKLWQQATN